MKKDIHEFSDTLQHGANSLVNATAQQAQKIQHMIAPVPDPNEDAIGTKTEELNAAESKVGIWLTICDLCVTRILDTHLITNTIIVLIF